MTLSIKQKALLATVGLFVVAIAAAGLVNFVLLTVSTEVLSYFAGGCLLYFFVSMVYELMLSKFEYDEKIKNLVDNK